jgi:hypothetical protein
MKHLTQYFLPIAAIGVVGTLLIYTNRKKFRGKFSWSIGLNIKHIAVALYRETFYNWYYGFFAILRLF